MGRPQAVGSSTKLTGELILQLVQSMNEGPELPIGSYAHHPFDKGKLAMLKVYD
jgi:hypothetical protein